MKVLKRLLAVLMAIGLSFGLTAGTVFAAPSATANKPTVVNTNTTRNRYVINTSRTSTSYSRIRRSAPSAASVIDQVERSVTTTKRAKTVANTLIDSLNNTANASGSSAPASVRESAKTVANEISGKEAVTGFFDIDKTGDNVTKADNGDYVVTLKIPTVTTSTKGITLLHFNESTQEWETITPTSTDLSNQEITVELSDLGQVIVLADEGTGTGIAADDNGGNGNNNGNGSNNNGNGTNGNGSNNKGNGSRGNGAGTNGSGSGSSGSNGSGSTGSGSSAKAPKTGVEDTWMGFAAAAAVLAGAGTVVLRKKKA